MRWCRYFSLLLLLTAAHLAAQTSGTKTEVLNELALLEDRARMKIWLDCDNTALAFEGLADLGDTHYEAAMLLLSSSRLVKDAVGLVEVSELLDKDEGILQDPNITRSLLRVLTETVNLPDQISSFAQRAEMVGADVRAWAMRQQTAAAQDIGATQLIADMTAEHKVRLNGAPVRSYKQIAFDHVYFGPPNGPNFLAVRNLTSEAGRRGDTPYATIHHARQDVVRILAEARTAVENGALSPSQFGVLRDFLKARRLDLGRGMVGPHRASYVAKLRSDGGHVDVPTLVDLGAIAAPFERYRITTNQFAQGISQLTRVTALTIADDTVQDLLSAATKTVGEHMELHYTVEEVIGGARYSYPIAINSASILLEKVFDPQRYTGVDLKALQIDATTQVADIRSRLASYPSEMFWALPRETAATLVLVKDAAEFVRAVSSAAVVSAPAERTAFVELQAIGPIAAIEIHRTTGSTSANPPASLSGAADATAELVAPSDTSTARFVRWVVDGTAVTARRITVTFGQSKVATLVRETPPPTNGSGAPNAAGWRIVGPDQLIAGQTGSYQVVATATTGETLVTSVARWDTTNTSLAAIDDAGTLRPAALLNEATTVQVLAWLPGATMADRLEKTVQLHPNTPAFKVEIVNSGPAGFSFTPEPTLVNGELLFPANALVEILATVSNGYTLRDWGDPALTDNPLRFVITENRRFVPNIVPIGAVSGPRRLTVDKPAGLGRITITAPRFTAVMERSDTRFVSDQLDHGEQVWVRCEAGPTEEFLGWVASSQGAEARFTMVDHVSVGARLRSRLAVPETALARTARITARKELPSDAYFWSSDNDTTKVIDNGEEIVARFSHGRPGRPDSFMDAYLKFPAYQLSSFPRPLTQATLQLNPTGNSATRGQIQPMLPNRNLTLLNDSTFIWRSVPEAIDYGAGISDVYRGSAWNLDLTAEFNHWLDGTWENYGLILRARRSDYQVAFHSANAASADVRPMLAVSWNETPAPPAAPIVRSRSPNTPTAPPGTTLTLHIDAASDTPVTCVWRRDGVVIPEVADPFLTVTVGESATYSVTLTNAVGAVTEQFVVSAEDAVPPVLSVDGSTFVADTAGRVHLTGTASDERSSPRVFLDSPTAQIGTVTGTTTWSADAVVPPGIHFAAVNASDDANNTSRTLVRLVNPVADVQPPVVLAETTRTADRRLLLSWRAADETGLKQLTVRAAGVTLATMRWPRSEGGLELPARPGAPIVEVFAEDFAGLVTTTAIPVAAEEMGPTTPAFTLQPQAQSAAVGHTATFTVAVTGLPSPTLVWQRSIDQGASWITLVDNATFSGTRTQTLAVLVTTELHGALFRALASNDVETDVASASASLAVVSSFVVWQRSRFSDLELADPSWSGPAADPDADGLNNTLEYAFATDPHTAEPQAVGTVARANDTWVFIYTRPVDRSDVTYSVEISTDLEHWTTTGSNERIAQDSTKETWRVTVPAADVPFIAFRIKVIVL